VAHSLDVWRELSVEARNWLRQSLDDDELSAPEETDCSVVELSRQFPTLSRAIAEYLAR
jgi:hypothetical protein